MTDENITPGEQQEKGPWAAKAAEGVVPDELGGDDAPAQEPELGSEVLGESTGDDAPATEQGVDPAGGDAADATTHGGAPAPPDGVEPDLRDAATGPREIDR